MNYSFDEGMSGYWPAPRLAAVGITVSQGYRVNRRFLGDPTPEKGQVHGKTHSALLEPAELHEPCKAKNALAQEEGWG